MKKWTLQILRGGPAGRCWRLRLRSRGPPARQRPTRHGLRFLRAAGAGRRSRPISAWSPASSASRSKMPGPRPAPKRFARACAARPPGSRAWPSPRSTKTTGDLVDARRGDRLRRPQRTPEDAAWSGQQSGWAIAAIEAAQMVKPPIPYGTPVFEAPEEQKPQTPKEEGPIKSAEEIDS